MLRGEPDRDVCLNKVTRETRVTTWLAQEWPIIDGDPTDEAWQDAYSSDRFYLTVARFAGKQPEGRSRFSIGHHDGTIYIAVLGYEDDLDKLHVTHTQRDSDVWRDDCIEIFFAPDAAAERSVSHRD